MSTSQPQKSVLVVLAVLLVAAWALIIWVAMEVTRTALETLSYIVDLAQYSP
jgi:predicted metal-binding membrane protein